MIIHRYAFAPQHHLPGRLARPVYDSPELRYNAITTSAVIKQERSVAAPGCGHSNRSANGTAPGIADLTRPGGVALSETCSAIPMSVQCNYEDHTEYINGYRIWTTSSRSDEKAQGSTPSVRCSAGQVKAAVGPPTPSIKNEFQRSFSTVATHRNAPTRPVPPNRLPTLQCCGFVQVNAPNSGCQTRSR